MKRVIMFSRRQADKAQGGGLISNDYVPWGKRVRLVWRWWLFRLGSMSLFWVFCWAKQEASRRRGGKREPDFSSISSGCSRRE